MLDGAPPSALDSLFCDAIETDGVLVAVNLLAFAFHTVAMLAVLVWHQARAARGARHRFFEHPRAITAHVVFQSWEHLLGSITDAAIRRP